MSIHICAVCDECDAETYWPYRDEEARAFIRWRKYGWLIEDDRHGTLCMVCKIEKGLN